MPLGLQIYFIGYVIAFIYCIRVLKDENGYINIMDLFVSILIALLSWTTVLALWLGANIKYSEDHRHDNDDNNLK